MLKKVVTTDMTPSGLKDWENKMQSSAIQFDNGGCVEFTRVAMRDADSKSNEENKETAIYIAMCDCFCEKEIDGLCSDKSEIIKLRDYLNRIIEDWED